MIHTYPTIKRWSTDTGGIGTTIDPSVLDDGTYSLVRHPEGLIPGRIDCELCGGCGCEIGCGNDPPLYAEVGCVGSVECPACFGAGGFLAWLRECYQCENGSVERQQHHPVCPRRHQGMNAFCSQKATNCPVVIIPCPNECVGVDGKRMIVIGGN